MKVTTCDASVAAASTGAVIPTAIPTLVLVPELPPVVTRTSFLFCVSWRAVHPERPDCSSLSASGSPNNSFATRFSARRCFLFFACFSAVIFLFRARVSSDSSGVGRQLESIRRPPALRRARSQRNSLAVGGGEFSSFVGIASRRGGVKPNTTVTL